jgi:hypothetical protein
MKKIIKGLWAGVKSTSWQDFGKEITIVGVGAVAAWYIDKKLRELDKKKNGTVNQ